MNYLWDTGTSAGITNGNGTWGTDNFWTTTGTSLTAWGGKADSAFFGGNNTLIGTPSGTFTITVNGTQQVTTIYQDVGTTAGTSSFIFTGGFLNANTLTITGSPAAYTSMTVNSVLVSNSTANITFSMSSFYRTISLGGDNTFTQNIAINGVTNGGGKLLLNHQNALGSGTMVTFNHGSSIDLNGYSISGKTVVNNRQGGLLNTGTTKSVWSGDVTLAGGSVNTIFTAGGTGAEVEISGVITGTSVDHAVRALDNTVLRLSGNNAYVGQTILRANSTLIAGHSNALGTSWGAWIDTGATLNLNGFNVGNIPVVMQTASSKLVNNDASNAASTSGTISLLTAGFSTREIGGAGNLTLGGVISGNNANAGFTKTGAGTLTLTGSNTYTGTTSVAAGTLAFDRVAALESSSGISIAAGTVLDYTGTAGTLSRNVTVSSSGTGTIRNSGGQTLTLSGTLTKDGRVLRLTGGVFDVTGRIVGTSANSDLLVDGTSTVTLSTTNSYVGPPFVNQASNLIVGINNAIPSNSVVTLGNATTTGTLSLGSFTNAIGGLAFGAGGGTLRIPVTSTSAAPLTAATGTMTLTNGTLDLAGSGSTAGLYRVLSAQSVSGSFTSVTGASPAYQVVTTASSVNYQQRAVLGAVTVTSPTFSIITGGSAAFTYTVANSALSGGASLSFTGTGLANVAGVSSGSAAAAGTSSSVSGFFFTGTSVGTSQQGTFTVSAPTAFGATTSTGTVAVTVLDHATSSLGSGPSAVVSTVLNLGTWDYASNSWTSGTNSGQFSIFNLASSFGAPLTADLSLVSVSGTANGFTTNLGTYTDIAGGSFGQYSVFVNPVAFSTSGTQSVTFTIAMSDKTGVSGAAASNTLFVTANVIVVPEPGALALAGLGIAAAAAWALRRRK